MGIGSSRAIEPPSTKADLESKLVTGNTLVYIKPSCLPAASPSRPDLYLESFWRPPLTDPYTHVMYSTRKKHAAERHYIADFKHIYIYMIYMYHILYI